MLATPPARVFAPAEVLVLVVLLLHFCSEPLFLLCSGLTEYYSTVLQYLLAMGRYGPGVTCTVPRGATINAIRGSYLKGGSRDIEARSDSRGLLVGKTIRGLEGSGFGVASSSPLESDCI